MQRLRELETSLQERELSPRELDEALGRLKAIEEMIAPSGVERHSTLKELRGLGKEIWEGIDVDEYIREERRSWR